MTTEIFEISSASIRRLWRRGGQDSLSTLVKSQEEAIRYLSIPHRSLEPFPCPGLLEFLCSKVAFRRIGRRKAFQYFQNCFTSPSPAKSHGKHPLTPTLPPPLQKFQRLGSFQFSYVVRSRSERIFASLSALTSPNKKKYSHNPPHRVPQLHLRYKRPSGKPQLAALPAECNWKEETQRFELVPKFRDRAFNGSAVGKWEEKCSTTR